MLTYYKYFHPLARGAINSGWDVVNDGTYTSYDVHKMLVARETDHLSFKSGTSVEEHGNYFLLAVRKKPVTFSVRANKITIQITLAETYAQFFRCQLILADNKIDPPNYDYTSSTPSEYASKYFNNYLLSLSNVIDLSPGVDITGTLTYNYSPSVVQNKYVYVCATNTGLLSVGSKVPLRITNINVTIS